MSALIINLHYKKERKEMGKSVCMLGSRREKLLYTPPKQITSKFPCI